MKKFLGFFFCGLLLAVNVAFGAEGAKPSADELIDACEKDLQSARQGWIEKLQAVEKAVSAAVKSGHLKTSTDAYYRDCLERLRVPTVALPALDGSALSSRFAQDAAYFPPRFDTSPEIEPINLAWSDLRVAVNRFREVALVNQQRLHTAASAELREVASTGEGPTAMDTAERLVAAHRKMAEMAARRMPVQGSDENLERAATLLRQLLEAWKNRQFTQMQTIPQRLGVYSGGVYRSSGTGITPDEILELFRNRIAKPLQQASEEARNRLDKALLERKNSTELKPLLAALAQARQDFHAANKQSGAGSLDRNTLDFYRAMVAAQQAIETGRDYYQVKSFNFDSEFAPSIEVRALAQRVDEDQKANQAARERQRQEEQRKEEENRRKQAQQVAEQKAAHAVATIRTRLLAVDKPQAAIALADEIPALASEIRDEDPRFTRLALDTAIQDLRAIAAWWLDSTDPAGASVSWQERRATHPFVSEMSKLRDRVRRDLAAQRLDEPQLRQPPLANEEIGVALEKLANKAADAGEWRRVYDIRRVALPLRPAPSAESQDEQMMAVKQYLTAQNFELAEQYRDAVRGYSSVLQHVTARIPVKEAAERLKALRAAHPEAFEAVETITDSPRKR
jgi:hypothetical protein